MTLLLSLLGAGLILVALRDIFDTLFHPSGKGMLSRALPRLLWRGVRRIGVRYPLAQELCGPTTLLSVIASWTTLLAAGWAFVFWPHLTEGFLLASGPNSSAHGRFVDAFYLSLVTLTTCLYRDEAAYGEAVGPRLGLFRQSLAPVLIRCESNSVPQV